MCEKLRNRVQYFLTVHNDSEPCESEYGTFAVHVDGEEIIRLNPMNKSQASDNDDDLSLVPKSVLNYLNQDISISLTDEDPIVRMLAIIDRWVDYRTLRKMADSIIEQPLWLQKIYRLRFDVEGIRSKYDRAGMKRVLITVDTTSVYLVPDEAVDDLELYIDEFVMNWYSTDKCVKKLQDCGTDEYSEHDFIEFLNKYKFPDKPSVFIETVKTKYDRGVISYSKKYDELEWFIFGPND